VNLIATDGGWWGLARPNTSPALQTGSWGYSVLPFVEQDNAIRADAQGASIKVFTCPTRSRDQPQTLASDLDFVYAGVTYINRSGRNPWCKTDYAVNWYLITNRWWAGGCPLIGLPSRIADITDGTSQTLLLGEKAMDTQAYNSGGWYFDEPIWAGARRERRGFSPRSSRTVRTWTCLITGAARTTPAPSSRTPTARFACSASAPTRELCLP
jgi:hypothetical protein